MSSAIVVGTHPGSKWLPECLASFPEPLLDKWPMIIVNNHGFEMGKIIWIYENTLLEEFLLLPDTVEIIGDGQWITDALEARGRSVACNNCPRPGGSFMMKYRRPILDKLRTAGKMKATPTKGEAIQAEINFHEDYWREEGRPNVLWPEMDDTLNFIHKHGQRRIILESPGLRKYKLR